MYTPMLLTNGINELEVDIKGDQWDRQESEVEFQHAGDSIDVIITFN